MKKSILIISISALLSLHNANSFASGFMLPFSNAAASGDAYAGAGVMSDDPSSAYSNPAALTLVKHKEINIGAVGVDADMRYSGSLTVYNPFSPPPLQPIPASGNGTTVNNVKGGRLGVIPNAFFARPLTQRLFFGFGITMPYGLGINYGDVKPISYAVDHSNIYDIDLVPAFGYKISKKWAVGAGLDMQYFHLDETTEMPVFNGTYSSDIDDYELSWHAGILFMPSTHYRIGLNFKSPQDFHLTGTDKVSIPNGGEETGHTLECDWHLPWVISLYASAALNSEWTLLSKVAYSGWDRFKNITYKNQTVPIYGPQTYTAPQHFKNSWDFSLGANYKINSHWLLRMGAGYSESPTDPTDQELWMILNDTFSAATGVQYTISKNCAVDVDYTHTWMKKINFNNPAPKQGDVPVQSIGQGTNSVNLYALQIDWSWG